MNCTTKLCFVTKYRYNSFQLPLIMARRSLADYDSFSKVLGKSQNIVVLTGAGVSAESGIPVFRGAGGWWRTYKAENLATPEAFRANPSLVWEFYHYRREVAFNSTPNKAHIALSMYEQKCIKEGRKFTLITQNVDGLHRRAGSVNLIELHGSLTHVRCTKCNFVDENLDNPICESLRGRGSPDKKNEQLPIIDKNDLPKCKLCNSLVRPHIVWFGENLERTVLEKSKHLMETCDLCLVIGTSSIVYPAAMFAPLVAERGKPVAEFNINEFPANDLFTYHFSGPCGTTLPKALALSDV